MLQKYVLFLLSYQMSKPSLWQREALPFSTFFFFFTYWVLRSEEKGKKILADFAIIIILDMQQCGLWKPKQGGSKAKVN